MKKLMLMSLFAFTGIAQAAPNVWNEVYSQGFSEYSIRDANGNTLLIACNDEAGGDYDHSAWLQMKNKRIQNTDSKYPLTFLLDGKTKVAPTASTKWRNGANAWYDFSHGIAKAKKIEVFVNNKKVTTFIPTSQSIKSTAKDIGLCRPMF
ncbi:hypothetical protein [Acinetobacter pullicarnis]|uniref:hypothetical protein n=1 Tax=Acinetobacter pullicarnis TaxID=2576829 RepID=UPI001124A315|nr:hypothetical protein [Acinetobacter pullicarnis]